MEVGGVGEDGAEADRIGPITMTWSDIFDLRESWGLHRIAGEGGVGRDPFLGPGHFEEGVGVRLDPIIHDVDTWLM